MRSVDLLALGCVFLGIGQLAHLFWHKRRGDF